MDKGSQIPYINEGKKRDFEILTLNTNENYAPDGSRFEESGTPVIHANYVWKNIVLPANAESVAIIGHSYAGHVVMWLARQYQDFFKEKVFAVAFTDAVETAPPECIREHISHKMVNWAASDKPVDTLVRPKNSEYIEFRSAGHVKHEYTTYHSQEAVFKYIDQRYEDFQDETKQSTKKIKLDDDL